ncbi:MAG: zinc ribbon domain-containing protein [Oscillospiraceae bacterium]
MECGFCGDELIDEAKFCLGCGKPRSECEKPIEVEEDSQLKCKKCGAEIESDFKFCFVCGEATDLTSAKENWPITKSDKATNVENANVSDKETNTKPEEITSVTLADTETENVESPKVALTTSANNALSEAATYSFNPEKEQNAVNPTHVEKRQADAEKKKTTISVRNKIIVCVIAALVVGVGIFYGTTFTIRQSKFNLSKKYYTSGKLLEAEKSFLELIDESPSFADAYIGLGDVYISNWDYPAAINTLVDGQDSSHARSLEIKREEVERDMIERINKNETVATKWKMPAEEDIADQISARYAVGGGPPAGYGKVLLKCYLIGGLYYAQYAEFISATVDGANYYLNTNQELPCCFGSWTLDGGYQIMIPPEEIHCGVSVYRMIDDELVEMRSFGINKSIDSAIQTASNQVSAIGPEQTFVLYYLSFLSAINEYDESNLVYCSENCYLDTTARIYNQNRNNTFYCRSILIDADSITYSADGTVSFNAVCESDMYSRDGLRYAGINKAYRKVNLACGVNGWYVDSAQYHNYIAISDNFYKAY